MAGLFESLTTANMEAEEDRIGGGYSALDSDIYTGKVKLAYAGQSAGGARNITLIMEGGDFGKNEYRETVYITNRKGENFYVQNDTKKQLPGFIVMNHLAQILEDCELSGVCTEEKMVKLYDPELKKEAPKSVHVLVNWLGKEVSLAIVKTKENKKEKRGNDYVPVADFREVNSIEKVLHTGSHMTVQEAKERQKPGGENVVAEFWDKWLERNKGNTRDKYDASTPAPSPKSGNNGASNGAAPQSGSDNSGTPARTSLFGG